MTPEEFADAIKNAWTGFWDGAYTIGSLLAEWLFLTGKWCWGRWSRFYDHLWGKADLVLTTWWRKLWGWLGLAVAGFTYIYAPLNHLAVDAANVNWFLGFCTTQYLARGAEKMISIGAFQIPGILSNFTPPPADA